MRIFNPAQLRTQTSVAIENTSRRFVKSLPCSLGRGALSLLLGLGLTAGVGSLGVHAAAPETAPPELLEILKGIETAANNRNLEAAIAYYSPDFVNSDNLDRSQLSAALQQLWERYSNITYRTELKQWEQQGDRLVTETVTYITGTQTEGGREITLESMVRSRQFWQNNQIVRQDILAEESQLSFGNTPPQLKVNLPDSVRPGQRYTFDAIVLEPLNNDLLLGAALEEEIEGDRYLNPGDFELEELRAGGLFKIGKAPDSPSDRWISAIFIRGNGTVIVTRRLRVEN